MRKNIITAILIMLILTGCSSVSGEVVLSEIPSDNASYPAQEEEGEEKEISESGGEEDVAENEPEVTLAVYVCGAVMEPGVYELTQGARIDDAVKAAGGFSDEADRTYVNLAAKLQDGMKLQIPTLDETEGKSSPEGIASYDLEGTGSFASEGSGLVNLNTASKEELKTLPGIGDGIAGKIISYREQNGSFKSIEDIMKVSGIKEKLFSKIKEKITV